MMASIAEFFTVILQKDHYKNDKLTNKVIYELTKLILNTFNDLKVTNFEAINHL